MGELDLSDFKPFLCISVHFSEFYSFEAIQTFPIFITEVKNNVSNSFDPPRTKFVFLGPSGI